MTKITFFDSENTVGEKYIPNDAALTLLKTIQNTSSFLFDNVMYLYVESCIVIDSTCNELLIIGREM